MKFGKQLAQTGRTTLFGLLGAAALIAILTAAWPGIGRSQEPASTTYTFSTISHPKGTTGTSVAKINNTGEIVGVFYYNSSTESGGFLDQSGKFTTILPSGSTYGAAVGLNNSGEIVGFY